MVLKNFEFHLTRRGGGKWLPERAAEIRRECTVILNHMDVPLDDIFDKFEDIEDKFLNVFENKLQASTLKNYLTSFDKFICYLSFKKLAGFNEAKEHSCLNQLTIWKRSFSKDVSVRRAEVANKDRGTFFSSSCYRILS